MNPMNFQSTKLALLKLISTESFPDNRLPAETSLAKRLRVSIVTLRQALSVLAAEGYITKRQGLGNFIHESALDRTMRTDLTHCVENLLLISGYQVDIRRRDLTESLPTDEETDMLRIPADTRLLEMEVLTRADGAPAALEIHHIPKSLVQHPVPPEPDGFKLESFFWESCERELAHEMTTWVPLVADERLRDLFSLARGTALIGWDEILYDTRDRPVCHTLSYFNPTIIRPRSLRKWNFGPRLEAPL